MGWSSGSASSYVHGYLSALPAGLDMGGSAVMGSITLAFGLAVSLGVVGAFFNAWERR
jgi:hypothetical protein